MSRAFAIVLLVSLALPGAGCSLAFVRRPPYPLPAEGEVSCTSDRVAPVLDVGLSVAAATLATVAYVWNHADFHLASDSARPSEGSSAEWGLSTLLTAGPFIASAIYGFHMTGQCQAAKERLARCDPATRRGCAPPDAIDPFPRGAGEPLAGKAAPSP
jgi:hypothetical protein